MMRNMFILLILAAAPAASLSAEKTEDDKDKPDKVVCRYEVPTGSVMGKRVCRTKAERDAMERQSKDILDRARSMTTAGR